MKNQNHQYPEVQKQGGQDLEVSKVMILEVFGEVLDRFYKRQTKSVAITISTGPKEGKRPNSLQKGAQNDQKTTRMARGGT